MDDRITFVLLDNMRKEAEARQKELQESVRAQEPEVVAVEQDSEPTEQPVQPKRRTRRAETP